MWQTSILTLLAGVFAATGPVLLPEFLPARLRQSAEHGDDSSTGAGSADDNFRSLLLALLDEGEPDLYQTMVQRLDRLVLEVLLDRTGGNQVQASRILGITRNTLRAKLRTAGPLEQRDASVASWPKK
jgi:DNA-binding protein Fis